MTMRILVYIILLLCSTEAVNGQLSPTFYAKSCPQVQSIAKSVVKRALAIDKRMGASLLQLHFHDCFVQGCDGSILLDDTPTFKGEKSASTNINSARGFHVIDKIKTRLEKVCEGVVSCADILTIAVRDSVVELGGPTWAVRLGRRDSRTANISGAESNIPSSRFNFSDLVKSFQAQGLSSNDITALAGGQTIGKARCRFFRNRIYNDSNIDKFAAEMQKNCPSSGGDNIRSNFDSVTPNVFDNSYYKNLIRQRGLFHSDQELFNGGPADAQVIIYSNNQTAFFNDFVAAMVNLANINPLTGKQGEIRKNCRRVNKCYKRSTICKRSPY